MAMSNNQMVTVSERRPTKWIPLGQDVGDSWSLSANVPVVNPMRSPVLWSAATRKWEWNVHTERITWFRSNVFFKAFFWAGFSFAFRFSFFHGYIQTFLSCSIFRAVPNRLTPKFPLELGTRVSNPKCNSQLCLKSPSGGLLPFGDMMENLQRLLRAVPVDDLNGRVVHTYGKHQGPIEGALAEAFGFTEEARRVMRIGELEEIFHAVERMEEISKFHLIVGYSLTFRFLQSISLNSKLHEFRKFSWSTCQRPDFDGVCRSWMSLR